MLINRPHVLVHGKGLPLVLFHGWGFDVHIWTPFLPYLANYYEVHLVDLPGFGLTPKMTFDFFKTKLLELLPEHFALIGWSMGGLYATRLAIEAPHRITHLVNLSSSPYFIRESQWPGIDLEVIKTFHQELLKNPGQVLKQFIEWQGQSLPIIHNQSSQALSAGLDVLMTWDLRQSIHQLNLPVHYVFGRLDAIVPRKTMVKMQALYPGFNYILFQKSSHALFLSHPNEFRDFLNSILL